MIADTKRLVRQDGPVLLLLLVIWSYGLCFIHSAGGVMGDIFFRNQIVWSAIGVGVAWWAAVQLSRSQIRSGVWLLYAVALLLLLAVPLFGKTIKGARRWLVIGSFTLQPSELMKPAFILALATVLSRNREWGWRGLIAPALVAAPPLLLILKQPDLGTTLTFLPVLVVMLFAAGISRRLLGGLLALGALVTPLLWFVLHEYQRDRLRAFWDPHAYESSLGYQAVQSFHAVGGGGWVGHGLGAGYVTQAGYLPDCHTDFIFSVVAEEWGFVGASFLILAYLGFLLLLLEIAARTRDRFGRLLVIGGTTLLFGQMVVNMGMTVGLTPITGLTLPFVSYGGSSLVTSFLLVGLILNVDR